MRPCCIGIAPGGGNIPVGKEYAIFFANEMIKQKLVVKKENVSSSSLKSRVRSKNRNTTRIGCYY